MRFLFVPWNLGLAVLGGLGVAAYLAGLHLDLPWLRLSSKAVPLLCLAVWLWPPRESYARWIAAGLALSLMGAGMSYAIMLLYWAGQLGIARSAVSTRSRTQGVSQTLSLPPHLRQVNTSSANVLRSSPAKV